MRLARREGFGPPLRRPVCSCIFQGFMVYSVSYLCRSDGMADVTDSKSVGSDTVWVRVPPSAPRRSKVRFAPPFQLRPALLARSWQAALRAAFFSNRRSRVSPFLPGRGAVRFAPIFFVPGKKRHPHARPAILRCGFSIPYSLRSLKTRQALRPFPFSLDVLRAWFVSNLQKKCPVLHLGTFLFLPSCYILCIERNIPQ